MCVCVCVCLTKPLLMKSAHCPSSLVPFPADSRRSYASFIDPVAMYLVAVCTAVVCTLPPVPCRVMFIITVLCDGCYHVVNVYRPYLTLHV